MENRMGQQKTPSKVREHQEGSTARAMHITNILYHGSGGKGSYGL